MARIGFKKVYAPGEFGVASVQGLYTLLKQGLIDAGFTVLNDTATTFDMLPAGVTVGTVDDDTPHWALRLDDQGGFAALYARAVHGVDTLDQQALVMDQWLIDSYTAFNIPQEFTLWFAADGREGWWWLHGSIADAGSPSGLSFRVGLVATKSRRYASDRYTGLTARYGLRDVWGSFYVPYGCDPGGNRSPQSMQTWTPLGVGTPVGKRHAASPLPRMAVPVFPTPGSWITACVMGELDHVLALTSGYAQLEEVVPGWIAFVGGDWDQPYAVPAPATFTVK
jgi:hypothetical protein